MRFLKEKLYNVDRKRFSNCENEEVSSRSSVPSSIVQEDDSRQDDSSESERNPASPTLKQRSRLLPNANFDNRKVNSVEKRVQEFQDACRQARQQAYLMKQPYEQAAIKQDVKKIAIHIKLDTDIVDFFKQDGPGYQTRINNFLRKAVDKA